MTDLFVSCVGNQPSAVAVTLKTWADLSDNAASLVLLATAGSREAADRLQQWALEEGIASVDVLNVDSSFNSSGSKSDAGTTLLDYLRNVESNANLVFFADPGLKAMVLSVVAALASTGRPYTRLQSGIDRVHAYRVQETQSEKLYEADLADIGLEQLLGLYGLPMPTEPLSKRCDVGRAVTSAFAGASRPGSFFVRHAPSAGISWIILTERRGRLHCLVTPEQPSDPEIRLPAAMIARPIMHLVQEYSPLRPRLTALAYGAVQEHLLTEGIACIDPKRSPRELSRWFEADLGPPGRTIPAGYRATAEGGNIAPIGDLANIGRSVLIEVLGLDTSANLISLATHAADRVRDAILLSDLSTPKLVQRGQWLRDELMNLGYANAAFLPVDHLGSGISDILATILSATNLDDLRIDLTPGTKAQACELITAVPDRQKLWTLDGVGGTTATLDGSRQMDLSGPGLISWARSVGGPTWSDGSYFDREDAFFVYLLRLLKAGRFPDTTDFSSWQTQLLAARPEDDGIELVREDGRLAMRDESGQTHPAPRMEQAGFQFEDMVATSFPSLDPAPDEIVTNIAWNWSPNFARRLRRRFNSDEGFRCEMDIAVRLEHRVFCVSCKSLPEDVAPSKAAAAEIETIAENGFGRFAIPVLARFLADKEIKEQSHKSKRGALILDRDELSCPVKLGEVLSRRIVT